MKTQRSILILFLTLLIFSFTACSDDDNANSVENYLGVYSVNESCQTGNDSYNITINESASEEGAILISNLYDFNGSVTRASVNGDNLTIANQTIQSNGQSVVVSGSGTINGTVLTITFTLSANDIQIIAQPIALSNKA